MLIHALDFGRKDQGRAEDACYYDVEVHHFFFFFSLRGFPRFIQELRPFLTQSDLSVEKGLFRLKPEPGFLIQTKKGFFDSIFFD